MGPDGSPGASVMPAIPERPRELLVAGHVNVDRFLSVRSFPPPDRTVPIFHTQGRLGGPAANLALVASRYGIRTGLVARIGDGFPEEFIARLERAHVDLRGLVRVPALATPTCYIVVDGQGHQRTLIDQGPMGTDEGRVPAPAVLGEYSWLHVTTGPPGFHLRLARQARRRGLRVAADPAQEIHYRWDARRLRALLADSEILFGNRSEISRAVQLAGADSPSDLVEQVPLVIRTEGASGVTAFAGGPPVHVRAVRPPRVRSLVGAGDAFRAGFYSGWFVGLPLEDCLRAGVRAASRWVARPGE